MADKNQIINYLKNLVQIIDSEIKITDSEIFIKAKQIDTITEQLKRLTQEIVNNENNVRKLEELLNDMRASQAKEQSIIRDLEVELNQAQEELYHVSNQIRAQQIALQSLGPFSFIAKGIIALIDSLTGEFSRIENRMRNLQWRSDELYGMLKESQYKEYELTKNIEQVYAKKKELEYEQSKYQSELQFYGREKTKTENLKLDLSGFKLKIQQVLEKINLNIEFDEIFHSKEEIDKQINEIYSKHGRTPPNGLLKYSFDTINVYYIKSSL